MCVLIRLCYALHGVLLVTLLVKLCVPMRMKALVLTAGARLPGDSAAPGLCRLEPAEVTCSDRGHHNTVSGDQKTRADATCAPRCVCHSQTLVRSATPCADRTRTLACSGCSTACSCLA
jgi:hypothetical protein